ncbi:helix-turn-helix transcriptional regulator [Umezawaea sp. Da 62-37]|uniref:helix-turn-helix domain-containing protein n=1 Tax=Umezawaea sp. Da 62-37 TaxID=3075927 RepID=UPI0028F6F41A|nr:helix-turn-helix transcriptional regulator [Umezawaea sp. Da 62-37]WNV89031.1 helix-turn-helix transcriptional regulator [Umezawaea sp. Da 62-37]
MSERPSPTILRVRLGHLLSALRRDAGKTPKEAAEWLGVSTSTISKIENGRQAVKLAHVRSLLQLFGCVGDRADELIAIAREANQPGWWVPFGDTVPEWFKNFLGLEVDADAIRTYELELVPGVLQTPAYTEAITRKTWPTHSDDEVARAVEFRRARQEHLEDRNVPRLHFVLNEAVLCRPVGGPKVWREQIEHLAEVARRPNATVQVLPFATGEHPVMGSAFTLLHFDDESSLDTVYLENDRGGHHLKSAAEIKRYASVFAELVESAASPENSLEMLVRVIEHL